MLSKKLSLPNDVSHVKRAKTAISLCLMDGQQYHMAASLAEEPYSSGRRQTGHNSLTVLRSEVASEPTDYSPMRTIQVIDLQQWRWSSPVQLWWHSFARPILRQLQCVIVEFGKLSFTSFIHNAFPVVFPVLFITAQYATNCRNYHQS